MGPHARVLGELSGLLRLVSVHRMRGVFVVVV
jgi:hypothetical protein